MSQRRPGERWSCEGCSEALIGAQTREGKVAPITVAAYDDGNVILHRVGAEKVVTAWTLGGDTLKKAKDNGVELRRNHFFGCPAAERFR